MVALSKQEGVFPMQSISAKADLFKLCLSALHAEKVARSNASPQVLAASQSTRTESETRKALGRSPRGWAFAIA